MSKALITESHLTDIANAIIAKGGATAPMTPAQMKDAILAIPSGEEWTWPTDNNVHWWVRIDVGVDAKIKFKEASFQTGLTINWGDGNSEAFSSGIEHTYLKSGDYEIVVSGGAFGVGNTSFFEGQANMGSSGGSNARYAGKVFAFYGGKNLNQYSIPCAGCFSLEKAIIRNWINQYAFSQCVKMDFVKVLCENSTSGTIADKDFEKCYSLKSFTIESSIKNFYGTPFLDCYSLERVFCKSSVPATLHNSNPFYMYNPNFKIVIPEGSLSAYQSATNWANYSDYFVEEAL